MQFEEHGDLIRGIAENNGVPVQLIRQILELEPRYRNLHAWGARSALQRALVELVDAASPSEDSDT